MLFYLKSYFEYQKHHKLYEVTLDMLTAVMCVILLIVKVLKWTFTVSYFINPLEYAKTVDM